MTTAIHPHVVWRFPEIGLPLVLDWHFPWNQPSIWGYPHDYGNPHIFWQCSRFEMHSYPKLRNGHTHSKSSTGFRAHNDMPMRSPDSSSTPALDDLNSEHTKTLHHRHVILWKGPLCWKKNQNSWSAAHNWHFTNPSGWGSGHIGHLVFRPRLDTLIRHMFAGFS